MSRWSFFSQILAGSVLVVLVALFAGVFVSERNISREFAAVLAEETRPLAASLAELLGKRELQARVHELGPRVDRRITVISLDGRVVADSGLREADLAGVENHAGRPEVQSALRQGWGWSRRHSATLDQDFLYVAVLDEEHGRIVRVAVPLHRYRDAVERLNWGMIASVLIGCMLAGLLAFAIARQFTGQVSRLVAVAKNRASGAKAAFEEGGNEEFNELAQALDAMTRRLDEQLEALMSERSRLKAVLDNMVEGVILCDAAGQVVVWNDAFTELFAVDDLPAGKTLIELTRVPEVVQLAAKVFDETAPLMHEFAYRERSVQATFVPLAGRGSEGYLAVFHDITDLKRADRIRRDFVANVSHELRTPLASISGYAESLLEGAIDDREVARPFVDGIARNADRLARLIDDILDLARIESGRYGFFYEAFDARAAVDAAATIVNKIKTKRQHFENRVEPGVPLWADKKAVSQILVNLIDNAAKYCPPGTEIFVTAVSDGAATSLAVTDRGHGIAPEDQPRIFERFYRADKSRNAAGEGGTGLGLAICKHLATEMGGAITLESSGRGTTFTVRLPAKRPGGAGPRG